MKATLIFKIPEEQDAYEAAYNGDMYKAKLDAIWGILRKERKYSELSKENAEYLDKLTQLIGQEMQDEL